MLDPSILTPEAQAFIKSFDGEVFKLIMAGSPLESVSVKALAQQIESRRKIAKKLPTWYSPTGIIYPPKLNLEQTSSEITAKYKASLVSGTTMADITGGFGVDSFYFAKKFDEVHHFEINRDLHEMVKHNFKVLGQESIRCFLQDGLQKVLTSQYDNIYADPSRRHKSKGKVYFLEDCAPNLPKNLEGILKNCSCLMIKTSPMLDISRGLEELAHVNAIHIVAVNNEVKELLWILQHGSEETPVVKAINLVKDSMEEFEFNWGEEGNPNYSLPQNFLYEPNVAILKSGAFNMVSERFKVNKLHPNTHLYTSEDLIYFPGRSFRINATIPYSKSHINKALNFKKANIAVRNFPISVEQIRKKWKIKDGGEVYLFFTTNKHDEKIILICSKI